MALSVFLISTLLAVGQALPGGAEKGGFEEGAVREASEHCAKEVKASHDSVEQLFKFEELDDSKEGKCMLHCLFSTLGTMDKEGHLDPAHLRDIAHAHYSQPEVLEKVVKIFDSCQAKTEADTDHCEHAFNFLDCIREESDKEHVPKMFKD